MQGKKFKHGILCLAQTSSCRQSAITLTFQRKGRKTTKRARTSTKLGLNQQGWCSTAVIPLTDRTHDPSSPHTSPWPCNLPTPPRGCCTPQTTCQGELASPGEEPGSEAADRTSTSQLWASSASEGSDNPLCPLPIRVSPLITAPKLLLTWARLTASPRCLTQIHTTKTRSWCALGSRAAPSSFGHQRKLLDISRLPHSESLALILQK